MRTYTTTLQTTALEFCQWLEKWIEDYNRATQPRWGATVYQLTPPQYVDILQRPGPYIVKVWRKPITPTVTHSLYGSRPGGSTPPKQPQRDTETLALVLTISNLDAGIGLQIQCVDGPEVRLERFVAALEAWVKADGLTGEVQGPEKPDAPRQEAGGLTLRQKEILQLVREGLSRQEIADQLVIQVDGVDSHIQNICAALGAPVTKSTPKLRRWLKQHGENG